MNGPLVVIGDALLDIDLVGRAERLAPDAPVPVVDGIEERPRPGGAALAAYLAASDGREVVLVTPLADDDAAQRLLALLDGAVRVVPLPYSGATPVKTRVRVDGQSLLRLDTGDVGGVVGAPDEQVLAALSGAAAVLVSDYGRGLTSAAPVRQALARLPGRVPVVWDPHPRGSDPVPGARLVTPNAAEAARAAAGLGVPLGGTGLAATQRRAVALVRAWEANAVAVTLGSRGALLSYGTGTPLVVPATPAATADPCGAGDRFAVTAATMLADGALPSEAVSAAVTAASAFVAAGGAGAATRPAPAPSAAAAHEDATAVAARVRAAGGTVVATGGCFDLLHAGHVATLRAARALGDCLVVCLNSDASVRRLKGPQRPLQPEQDRAKVLEALTCVDAVAIFDEDTPEAVLDRIRPDVWAKGGDYAGVDLPEAALLASWGGQAVVLPYLAGRSTSGLVHAARVTGAEPPHREETHA
jgi:rfaE bifunctional protein nucleotidyltransferase chain/domain/rfaE bifunctional protein kinase chain/domain